MKKSTFKKFGVISFVGFPILLVLAIMPGLNFSIGHGDYFGFGRKSRDGWQVGAIAMLGHGLRYEWHENDNPSINGSKGLSYRRGVLYLRIGNTELYTTKSR